MHLVLLATRLEQAVLSFDKLSEKKKLWCRIKDTITYIFFESVVKPFITKEEPRGKMNATTCRMLNNFNCYYGNLLQSNNDYEIIEYYYSVAKPYCRKKAITCIVFQKNKKQNLSWNNMVLVTIDSSKGSLPIASWPSNICAAIFLFFSLPYVCYHNSDKFRYHNICISTSSFVSSFQWKFSSVKQRCFHFFFWNDGHREYKFVPVIRCQIQNFVYRLQVIKTNSNVR